jgi:hypothetical protein
MLTIVNVTQDPNAKIDDYEVRVNRKVLVSFQHVRKFNGAAECLRLAADAVEAARLNECDIDELMDALMPKLLNRLDQL